MSFQNKLTQEELHDLTKWIDRTMSQKAPARVKIELGEITVLHNHGSVQLTGASWENETITGIVVKGDVTSRLFHVTSRKELQKGSSYSRPYVGADRLLRIYTSNGQQFIDCCFCG